MARFVRLAGYEGLMVCLDEMVNLYKLSHTQARTSNYEQLLRIHFRRAAKSVRPVPW
jgi:hypothetical protein